MPPAWITYSPLPPLFLVHSLDRDVMGYVGLVRHLGGKQPAAEWRTF